MVVLDVHNKDVVSLLIQKEVIQVAVSSYTTSGAENSTSSEISTSAEISTVLPVCYAMSGTHILVSCAIRLPVLTFRSQRRRSLTGIRSCGTTSIRLGDVRYWPSVAGMRCLVLAWRIWYAMCGTTEIARVAMECVVLSCRTLFCTDIGNAATTLVRDFVLRPAMLLPRWYAV
eukprot:441235-Rhodomonas_salina.1